LKKPWDQPPFGYEFVLPSKLQFGYIHLPKWKKVLRRIVGATGHTSDQHIANYGEEALIPDANHMDMGFWQTSHIHFNDKN